MSGSAVRHWLEQHGPSSDPEALRIAVALIENDSAPGDLSIGSPARPLVELWHAARRVNPESLPQPTDKNAR